MLLVCRCMFSGKTDGSDCLLQDAEWLPHPSIVAIRTSSKWKCSLRATPANCQCAVALSKDKQHIAALAY